MGQLFSLILSTFSKARIIIVIVIINIGQHLMCVYLVSNAALRPVYELSKRETYEISGLLYTYYDICENLGHHKATTYSKFTKENEKVV